MNVSIEISLYPLAETTFKAEVWAFIRRLRAEPGLNVVTNGMSTQVFGEYDLATTTVLREIKQVHEELGSAVFVCKFASGDLSEPEPEI